MKILKTFIILLLFVNCSNKKSETEIIESESSLSTEKKTKLPFELTINEFNESQNYFIRYILTKDKLSLTKGSEMRRKNDTIIYANTNFQKDRIEPFLKIEIDSLTGYYANVCISGGDIKSFTIKNNDKSKTIRLDNYYHKDLSPAIELINEIVPEKYKLNYNKNKLINDIIECDKKYPRKS